MSKFNILVNTSLKVLYPGYSSWMKSVKKALEFTFTLITFIVVPLIILTIITSRTSALFGFQSFTVMSGSMTPAITTGSIVYTQKADSIDKGDVITFERKNINVTHRVVDITDKNGKSVSSLVSPLPGAPLPQEIFYKVKGDANNEPDADLVPQNKVIGKTFINIPAIGRWTSFLKTIPGLLIFIIGPTLIFIGFELWNIKKEIEKQTERKIMERLG